MGSKGHGRVLVSGASASAVPAAPAPVSSAVAAAMRGAPAAASGEDTDEHGGAMVVASTAARSRMTPGASTRVCSYSGPRVMQN